MTKPHRWRLGPLLALLAMAPAPACSDEGGGASAVGDSFRVPYRLTETNHFLVRARLNGEGPFNFVVDTGAPALFLSREAAAAAGVEPGEGKYFSTVERVEFEGGAVLTDVQARAEDIYQLVGMNALGLAGAQIDGMVGFNVLARFRITVDPTVDRMTWTRIKYEPPDLPEPPGGKSRAPAEVQAMGAVGGLAQLAAIFVGKQPEDTRLPRGFLGITFGDPDDRRGLPIAAVLPGTPAEAAGLKPGDRLLRIGDRRVRSLEDAREAIARVEAGDALTLRVAGADDEDGDGDGPRARTIELTAGEGL